MMIRKIEQAIDQYHLLEDGEKILVAFSGGADSCTLLECLADIATKRRLELLVAHFNHGLRGMESDQDELFCRDLAAARDLVFVAGKMENLPVPAGMSPEDYYRRQRYHFLNRVALEHGATKIALGHHMNDQAETVLINILRGSGLDGLKGFLPIRDGIYIRPLVHVTREEILDFLRKNNLAYREDSSNQSPLHLRNRVRHELIPFLRERYNPGIEKCIVRMAEIIRRDDAFLEEHVEKILASPFIQIGQTEVSISIDYFKSLPDALRFRVMKALLERLASRESGFTSAHMQALVDLITVGSTGKKVSLPYGIWAHNNYGWVILQSFRVPELPDYEYEIKIPGDVDLKQRRIIISARMAKADEIDFSRRDRLFFDRDRISEPLLVRNRRRGDWFQPLGTQGRQKIKKLFIDRKIPLQERNGIALIADQESVIWIENLHVSERVKVSPETKRFLLVELKPAV